MTGLHGVWQACWTVVQGSCPQRWRQLSVWAGTDHVESGNGGDLVSWRELEFRCFHLVLLFLWKMTDDQTPSTQLKPDSLYSIFSKSKISLKRAPLALDRLGSQWGFHFRENSHPHSPVYPREDISLNFTGDLLEIFVGLCEDRTTWWEALLCSKLQVLQGRNLLFSITWIELSAGGYRS